jgi:hypothetical protein
MGSILSKCLGKDRTSTTPIPQDQNVIPSTTIQMVSIPIVTPEAHEVVHSPPNPVVPLATAEMKPPDTTDTGTMIKNEAIETSQQQVNTYHDLADSNSLQETPSSGPALAKRVPGKHAPHKGISPGNADGENRETDFRKKQLPVTSNLGEGLREEGEGLREETEEEISQRMVLEAIRR